MIIVIPMAGLGTRFRNGIETRQKAIILFQGTSLLEYALRSLPIELASKVVFVVRKEQLESDLTKLIEALCKHVPYEVIELESETRGQAESVYLGLKNQKKSESVLIHNCDTALNSIWNFETPADGIFFAFQSNSPSFSYARIDSAGRVVELAEKKVISNLASSGTYWIRSAETYLSFFERYRTQNTNEELYVVPVMQLMLESNMDIEIRHCEVVFPLGTPADLAIAEEIIWKWVPHW